MRGLKLADVAFLARLLVGIVGLAEETFQDYSDGGSVSALNAGTGWSGASVISDGFETGSFEDFQSYSDGGSVSSLSGGSGWSGPSVVT